MKRRDFLKTGVLGAAASQVPLTSYANVVGANDQVRLAILGVGGRGNKLFGFFAPVAGAKIVALADADSEILGTRQEEYSTKLGYSVDKYEDYREILDRDDIDAVIIATPNHWHAKMAVDVCRAGKAAYTEKPVCHNMVEGRKMLQAISETGQLTAAGFQNRSDIAVVEAYDSIQAGDFGAIKKVHGFCYRQREGIGKSANQVAPPKSLNYELWLGPAEDKPIYRPNYHYDWHWDYNTGNGDMGNQGPHELDMIRWLFGDPNHPRKIQSSGGRFVWDDAGNSFNMQFSEFDFGNDIPVVFEVRNMVKGETYDVGNFRKGPGVGVMITCEKGTIVVRRGGAKYYDPSGKLTREVKGDSGQTHYGNFVESIRSNDPSKNNSSLESAYYSSCLSHLANATALAGKPAEESAIMASVADSKILTEIAGRYIKQLKATGVDYRETPWQLGEKLGFDADSEQFNSGSTAAAANALLSRKPRGNYGF